jgi:site-specific DNA-methyltransferase (adenine-specific)
MEVNKIYNEPCLDTLKKMQDKSIDCVITSPPYWQLRDYGYEGQWGLEPTFQEYLEHLWQMMDEIYRVLKDEGTCWINLGDSFLLKVEQMQHLQEVKIINQIQHI